MSRDVGVDTEDAYYAPIKDTYLASWFDARELQMKAEGRIVVEGNGKQLYRQDDVYHLIEKYGRQSEGHTK
jgi:hypothetical protein